MRYRSTLFVSRFVQSPSVSYCQIIRQDDSLDLAILEANLNALGMDTNHSEFLLVVSNESDLESLKSKFANELNNGLLKVAIPESVKNSHKERKYLNFAAWALFGVLLILAVNIFSSHTLEVNGLDDHGHLENEEEHRRE
mgnify:CR=1 FL=1